MPYSGKDDPDLPANVKSMPADDRAQWVEVFNSVFNACIKDGGTTKTCESSAFKQANGVLKNKNDMKGGVLVDLRDVINKLFHKEQTTREVEKWTAEVKKSADQIIAAYNKMGEIAPEPIYELAGKTTPIDRMQTLGAFYEAVWNAVQLKDTQAWLNDIFMEEDGTMLAIIASGGKLYKTTLGYSNGELSMSDWIEVELSFPEVTQSRTTIHRMQDGKIRWLSVSGSTVLNRSGQIDSKRLFDSFVQHIEETGEYPVRMFCHCGEQFVTGQVDFVARDENLLITSGIYNDTELAKREVAAREKDPDYWGESVGFQSEGMPDYVEIADDVRIPVFTEGVLREVSAVPEMYAAAWFTQTTQFKNEEVSKMLDTRAKEALVKLFDGDENAANKWLEDNVDAKNRIIEERQLITREIEEVTEPDEPASEDNITQEVDQPDNPVTAPTLEIDDSILEAIVTQLATRQGGEMEKALTPIKDAIKSLDDRVSALEKSAGGSEEQLAETPIAELSERISVLETKVEKERTKAWYEDLPVKSTLRVTHRPREGAAPEEAAPTPPPTYADVAESTLQSLDKLKTKY